MPRPFPAPDRVQPLVLPDGSVHEGTVFLKPAVAHHARFDVGDYSYASSFDPPADWAARLAPWLYDFSPEKLVIGKFCQIADGVRFVTASANHRYDGISSYPFAIFDALGEEAMARPSMPDPGRDTIVGNDVWLGAGALILPGARIGSGVIVGAGAVVGGTIPDFAVVTGNPAKGVRMRFTPAEIATLLDIAWWDWPIAKILAHEAEISGGDVAALARVC